MLPPDLLNDTCQLINLNGKLLPAGQASISPFDRGYMFADGVYEGVGFAGGAMIDNPGHFARLRNSLSQLVITCPWSDEQISDFQTRLMQANACGEGFCYYQITRGVASRDFAFPPNSDAQLLMFLKPARLVDNPLVHKGVSVALVPDTRWKRRSIKSIALLAQVLAKQQAREQGCFEAWMVEDGEVNEGSSTSAFIVNSHGQLVTAPLSERILPGVTRKSLLEIASSLGIEVIERHFSPAQAQHASEAFISSASLLVMPVCSIDGQPVGNGCPGELTLKLRQAYVRTHCQQALAGQS